jgi:RNA polymerase I-specific transcription initiation factor RRN6
MTPTIIPPNVSKLLSHWQPGIDPSTYDWEATERVLQTETPDETSQELREKERKKKERREKRQRREDELLRAKSQTSSQSIFAQPAFPRSSPGPMFGGMASSSQAPIPMSSQQPSQSQSQGGVSGGFGGVYSVVPQSQVEPGRFGGRPDKKKKKGKSRVSGF